MASDSRGSTAPIDAAQLLQLFATGVRDHALIIIDTVGTVTSWNASAEQVKDFRADEIIGRHFSCFYPPEDVAAGKPDHELRIALSDGRFEATGYRLRNDGTRFLANVVIVALHDSDGTLRGFGKIVRDITFQAAAEDRLHASEARLRSLMNTILDTLDDGLVTIDRQGTIRSFNRACVRLFGYNADEAIGRNVKLLMPEPYRSQHDGYIGNYLRTHVPKIIGVGREVIGLRKDGSTFPLELLIGEAPNGGEHAFVATMRNLTERHEAEAEREQLRQAQKMEAVGQLTGGMAHDFNNLLAIIIGNLDLLRELEGDDPDADELLGDAIDAAVRGADLTRRLLAFARRQPLTPERLDPNVVIGNFVQLLRRTLGEDIVIELVLSSASWTVTIDRAQLEAAIANLATNARDAMPTGGRLRIVTRQGHLDEAYAEHHTEVRAGDYMVVEVSDTGIGMSPDILDRIFEPFFTTKERGKGTGLGLSMVFGFMKQSGGHVSVYSAPGQGTTFNLYLPRDDQPPPSPALEEQPAAPSIGGNETILVVEDNTRLLRVVARQLSEAGYRVLQAEDAEAALTILRAVEPLDLLMTDIVMPGQLDGRDLARAAVALRPGLKVLLTSGFPDARLAAQPGESQADYLLGKPYRKEELTRAVRALLDGKPLAAL